MVPNKMMSTCINQFLFPFKIKLRVSKASSLVQHSFVEIHHEIFTTVILSLPLIQEGQLSVSGERMYKILRGLSLPSKRVVR